MLHTASTKTASTKTTKTKMVGIVNPEALDWPGFPTEGSKKDRLIFIRIICVLFLFEFLFLFSKIFKDWFRFL